MAAYDFSIRTKLTIWAGVGVLLVAGMLANQQIGDHYAALQRISADNKQLAAVEALRAADDLRSMQLETREIRLSVAPREFDSALQRLYAAETAAAGHIEIALEIIDEPGDKERLEKLAGLVKAYVGVVTELAAAAKDYGDTVTRVNRSGELGGEMNALIEATTAALISAAEERKNEANAETVFVSRLDLGIGLFIVAVLAGVAIFGAVAISRPIRRIGEVLLSSRAATRTSRSPIPGAATKSATMRGRRRPSRTRSSASSNWKPPRRRRPAACPSSARPTCIRSPVPSRQRWRAWCARCRRLRRSSRPPPKA